MAAGGYRRSRNSGSSRCSGSNSCGLVSSTDHREFQRASGYGQDYRAKLGWQPSHIGLTRRWNEHLVRSPATHGKALRIHEGKTVLRRSKKGSHRRESGRHSLRSSAHSRDCMRDDQQAHLGGALAEMKSVRMKTLVAVAHIQRTDRAASAQRRKQRGRKQ